MKPGVELNKFDLPFPIILAINQTNTFTKRVSESILFAAHRQKGLDMGIVRIFNTYGSYMDPNDGRVISNFINQALEDKDITVYGDGRQTRSICYIDAMV